MRDLYLMIGIVVVFSSLLGIYYYFQRVNDQRIAKLEKLIDAFVGKKGLEEIKELVKTCNFTNYVKQMNNCLSGTPAELYPIELELDTLKTMVEYKFQDLEIENQILKIQQLLRDEHL